MTSVMVLDCVTLLMLMLQIHVNVCKTVQLSHNFFSAMAKSWKKPKTSIVFLSFIVCLNGNRFVLLHELLSKNSLFVGQ